MPEGDKRRVQSGDRPLSGVCFSFFSKGIIGLWNIDIATTKIRYALYMNKSANVQTEFNVSFEGGDPKLNYFLRF